AGYFDQNNHDTLRADPVFKLVAGRSPEEDDLASQPTLSRFENAIFIKSLKRLRDVFLREHQAARQQEPARTAVPSRLFTSFWYQAGTWPQPRRLVAKVEANDRGTNRPGPLCSRAGVR